MTEWEFEIGLEKTLKRCFNGSAALPYDTEDLELIYEFSVVNRLPLEYDDIRDFYHKFRVMHGNEKNGFSEKILEKELQNWERLKKLSWEEVQQLGFLIIQPLQIEHNPIPRHFVLAYNGEHR